MGKNKSGGGSGGGGKKSKKGKKNKGGGGGAKGRNARRGEKTPLVERLTAIMDRQSRTTVSPQVPLFSL